MRTLTLGLSDHPGETNVVVDKLGRKPFHVSALMGSEMDSLAQFRNLNSAFEVTSVSVNLGVLKHLWWSSR